MRELAMVAVALSLMGCATRSQRNWYESSNSSESVAWSDPLMEFRQQLPLLSVDELDKSETQQKIAECIVTATPQDRPVLLRYLCDPDAVEHVLNLTPDLDAHLASNLLAELTEDVKVSIVLKSRCRSTRVTAALAVHDRGLRRMIICRSTDAAVRNAYAVTLDESEVELLTLLAADTDKNVANIAACRLGKINGKEP